MKRYKNVKANWRVEALPNRTKVFKALGRGPITLDLDIGRYVFVVHHFDSSKTNNFKYTERFYHGVTKEQWASLGSMRPTIAKPMNTTQGLVYRCGFVGCKEETTSRLAAVIHESEHQGVNLLEEPEKYDDVSAELSEYSEVKAGKVPDSRKPGRPRKRL